VAYGVTHKPRTRTSGEICHARAPGRTACAPGHTACAPGRFRAVQTHLLNLGAASVCVAIYNLLPQATEHAPSGITLLHVSLLPSAITCQVLRRNTTAGWPTRVLPVLFPLGFDSLLPRKAPFCSLSFLITIPGKQIPFQGLGPGLHA
jgi:hypothetical protein